MEQKILMIKNITREGPGLLQRLLEKNNIPYDIVDLHKGEKLPPTENYSTLVVLGGPDSANDQNEKMISEGEYVKEALEREMPYIGICLGLQVLVKAAGGAVIKSPYKEVGFIDHEENPYTIEINSEDPLFESMGKEFRVFQLHGETIELGENMTTIASGKWVAPQVVRVGKNAYGIQCHFELTPEMFEEWITTDPDLLQIDTDTLRKQFAEIQEEYTATGIQLLTNFLKIAGYSIN